MNELEMALTQLQRSLGKNHGAITDIRKIVESKVGFLQDEIYDLKLENERMAFIPDYLERVETFTEKILDWERGIVDGDELILLAKDTKEELSVTDRSPAPPK